MFSNCLSGWPRLLRLYRFRSRALPFPVVISPQHRLVLFHLGFHFAERLLAERPNALGRACRVQCPSEAAAHGEADFRPAAAGVQIGPRFAIQVLKVSLVLALRRSSFRSSKIRPPLNHYLTLCLQPHRVSLSTCRSWLSSRATSTATGVDRPFASRTSWSMSLSATTVLSLLSTSRLGSSGAPLRSR
jgi:hypothetical protein